MWICSFSAETALQLHGRGDSNRAHARRFDLAHGNRHFSQDRHPGGERNLEFPRRGARGNRETPRHSARRRHDHNGERHRGY
jgi:hypothetical protein